MKIKHKIFVVLVTLVALLGAWNIAEIKTIETGETKTELSRQFLAVYLRGHNKPLPEVERDLTFTLARVLPIGTPIRDARAMLIESGFAIDPIDDGNVTADVLSATKLPFVTDGVFLRTWSSVHIRLHGIANGTITSENVQLCYSFPTGC